MGDYLGYVTGIPGTYVKLSSGSTSTCVLNTLGDVYCFGSGANGALGTGNTNDIGDEPSEMGLYKVILDDTVEDMAVMDDYLMIKTMSGKMVNYGYGLNGRLGYGSHNNYGDGASILDPTNYVVFHADVSSTFDLGTSASDGTHSCVMSLATDNVVRPVCWGENTQYQLGLGNSQFGYGFTTSRNVVHLSGLTTINGDVVSICTGYQFTCLLNEFGTVNCWGVNGVGQIGLERTNPTYFLVGPTLSSDYNVPLGQTATDVQCGRSHACARLADNTLRCWGDNTYGQLGVNVVASSVGRTVGSVSGLDAVDLGSADTVSSFDVGSDSVCAVLTDNVSVRCWGRNIDGVLGIQTTGVQALVGGELESTEWEGPVATATPTATPTTATPTATPTVT